MHQGTRPSPRLFAKRNELTRPLRRNRRLRWSSARSRTVRGRERGSYELKYAEQAATGVRGSGTAPLRTVGKSGAAYFALTNPAVPGRIGRHEFLSTVRTARAKREAVSPFCQLDCVDVSLPISLPLRFSIPVGVDGGGLGLCVELVLPIPSPEGEPATPFSPADGAPPVSAARETMLEPMKMAKAAAAVPMLRRIKRSLLDFAKASTCLLRGNARAWARFGLGFNLTRRAPAITPDRPAPVINVIVSFIQTDARARLPGSSSWLGRRLPA